MCDTVPKLYNIQALLICHCNIRCKTSIKQGAFQLRNIVFH